MIWYPLQIRFRDLDPLAHVNNTVYFTYYEEARSYYFKHLDAWLPEWPSDEVHQVIDEREQGSSQQEQVRNSRIHTAPDGKHYGMLVKEMTCTYALPLVRSDHAEVGVRVVKLGRTSVVMEHEIRERDNHERIFATGRSVMVWCNYRTGRPQTLPPSLRSAIEQLEGQDFSLATTT